MVEDEDHSPVDVDDDVLDRVHAPVARLQLLVIEAAVVEVLEGGFGEEDS